MAASGEVEHLILPLSIAAIAASASLTFAMRRLALASGLLDIPNERSSHERPTPRAGGAAIVLTATAGFAILAALHALEICVLVALLGGLGVAAAGFADDRRPLPAGIRLVIHLIAAIWAIAWLGGFPPLRIGDAVRTLGPVGEVVGIIGVVWALNLFNFMDGIDGLAASEATFIAWSGAMLAGASAAGSGTAAAAVIFGASCLGFLRWNWPPASIFMGDVGSGFLGYVVAVLALGAARQNPVGLWTWLILGGVFFSDATVTLLRRLLRGERVYQAHRSHAYQWLARRWGSHRKVTVAFLAVNFLWLFPWAMLATRFPPYAALSVVAALAPLALLAAVLGAGRSDKPPDAGAA